MTLRIALLVTILLGLPGLALAQTVRVTAGEHAGFTRLVLQLPVGLAWSLDGAGRERSFGTDRDLTFDLSSVFRRIPRTRLAAVRQQVGGVALDLACDCPTRAWQERPGLVVIDISDPLAALRTERSTPLELPAIQTRIVDARGQLAIDAARTAGEQLGRARAENAAGEVGADRGIDTDPVSGLAEDLGRQFSQALSQGLLDPAIETAARGPVLRGNGVEVELPANMRIVDVTERPQVSPPPAPEPDPACRGAEALEFLLDWEGPDFSQGLSRFGQTLFGEFDQASEQGFVDLIRHYLASGLGAEARSLIANLSNPLPGRDLLLGFSDLLEDRMSNSRMRLAEAQECGGAAALGAILAQPRANTLRALAASITLTFGRLPSAVQAALGPPLVTALLDAGARDEARIVANALRQSPWSSPDDVVLVDALLEESRGDPDRAADHLDSIAMRSLEGTRAWLELALEQQMQIAPETLADAEALATENRAAESGIAIMAATIRLRAASGQPDEALVALDRLESWNDGYGSVSALVGTLRDEIWARLSEVADDHALLALTLARSDWLDPGLSLATRQALGARLIDLGFARAAERLLSADSDEQSLRLRATAALQQGDTESATRLVAPDISPAAVEIRAASANLAGNHTEAAELLDRIGIVDGAARAAILDADWRRLDELRRRGARPDAVPDDVSIFLGATPGLAELALSQSPVGTPNNVEEEPSAGTPPNQSSAPATEGIAAGTPEPQPDSRDPADMLDRMGMVSRASLLLAESERLRDAIGLTLRAESQR